MTTHQPPIFHLDLYLLVYTLTICLYGEKNDMGIYLLRLECRLYNYMHALKLVPLVSRNKGISITKIKFVKLRLPINSL